MNNLEQKLYTLELPEETDVSHQYRLRRALLTSPYFGDSPWSIFFDRARFSMTSKRVVATVTIALVITIGGVTNYSMKASTFIEDEKNRSNSFEEQGFTSGLLAQNSSFSVPAETVSGNMPLENQSDDTNGTLLQAAASAPDGRISDLPVTVMSFAEMTRLLQEVYSNHVGTLTVELEDGMYVFSFDDLSEGPGSGTFGITSFTPDIQLISK